MPVNSDFSQHDPRTNWAADARAIWQDGVAAVDSARLVRQTITVHDQGLWIGNEDYSLASDARIVVVGGGKAGAGMAAGLEAALRGSRWFDRLEGLLNVPADCVRPLARLRLHPGRPPGVNEPTAEGVAATTEMLRLVATLRPRDFCLVLISGGGSALLPAPVDGITLADKLQVTRALMASGADIEALNAVRSCLSRIKAGGLLRAMAAGRGVGLIISDVVGDPLPVIASGPTVATIPDPRRALTILQTRLAPEAIPHAVRLWLEAAAGQSDGATAGPTIPFRNLIIGNNRTAVSAAAAEARRRGYRVVRESTNERGIARDVGLALAEEFLARQHQPCPGLGWCVISGGEPVVHLVPTDQPRRGGRNQELILAAADRLWHESPIAGALLSGGTDGEDGPTDAAGAWFDAAVQARGDDLGITPGSYLAINNAYPFFEATGGLLRTGPTHTNVMDLRVMVGTCCDVRRTSMPLDSSGFMHTDRTW